MTPTNTPPWRDLNGNGVLDPYEDPRLSPTERTEDLLRRLSLEEKVGLMFQTVIETGPDGTLLEAPGMISKSPTSVVVGEKFLSHFNVHALGDARQAARWMNALQEEASHTPHGIPVTVSTDPRHGFVENSGTSFSAGAFSQWPEPLGLAALGEGAVAEFAAIARAEYRAVGLRSALHPQVDLATEPRWGRQMHTFGDDPELSKRAVRAYLAGFQGDEIGPSSVACVTKHFPGAGPQKDGEDAHFPYGREQVYPGGAFDVHLEPFRAAIEAGTAAMMPYYGMPVGLTIDGEVIEEVGFGYNKQILTGLLREKLGYQGVIVTDWELVNDNHVGNLVLPARAWGAEHLSPPQRMLKILDAGADQFGGEECTDLLLELVRTDQVPESRIDDSARRLLLVKFQLGLFDNPFVDEEIAASTVGRSDFVDAGMRAQSASVIVLKDQPCASGDSYLPLALSTSRRLYIEGINPDAVTELGIVVERPEDADVAVIRIEGPFEPRDDLFLEAYFHQGSLDFRPGLISRLGAIARTTPIVLDVALDRPAILAPLSEIVSVLTASFGSSDRAWVDALTHRVVPKGRLPFEIPRSMDAVRASREDVAHDTVDPLYPVGFRFGD